jgi:hypothetical protein
MWAWQAAEKIGITGKEIDTMMQSALSSSDPSYAPSVPRKFTEAYKALPDAEKTAAVKELIGVAKGILMSPQFLTSQDKMIWGQYGGKDHGLKVPSREAAEKQLNAQVQAKKITRAQMEKEQKLFRAGWDANDVARNPYADSLRSRLEGDARSLEYQVKSNMAAEPGKPTPAELLEKTKAVLAIPKDKANEEAFRKAFLTLASYRQGGPSDEAAVMELVKQEQQRIYDQYAPKGKIKAGLEEFVANAAKVNFKATTAPKGKKMVFTDPAMERAPSQIKFLYRLGAGPTAVAVEAAKQMLKEL